MHHGRIVYTHEWITIDATTKIKASYINIIKIWPSYARYITTFNHIFIWVPVWDLWFKNQTVMLVMAAGFSARSVVWRMYCLQWLAFMPNTMSGLHHGHEHVLPECRVLLQVPESHESTEDVTCIDTINSKEFIIFGALWRLLCYNRLRYLQKEPECRCISQ